MQGLRRKERAENIYTKMKITILRKMKYEDTFIYVMQFDKVFQYLFSWNGEIYQDNLTLEPSFLNNLKYQLGLRKSPFTIDELEEGEKAVLSGAMLSIDKIIENGGKTRQFAKKKEKQVAEIEQDIVDRSGQPCVWRAIDMTECFYYECLTHGMLVKMKDGEKPTHDFVSPMQLEDLSKHNG